MGEGKKTFNMIFTPEGHIHHIECDVYNGFGSRTKVALIMGSSITHIAPSSLGKDSVIYLVGGIKLIIPFEYKFVCQQYCRL